MPMRARVLRSVNFSVAACACMNASSAGWRGEKARVRARRFLAERETVRMRPSVLVQKLSGVMCEVFFGVVRLQANACADAAQARRQSVCQRCAGGAASKFRGTKSPGRVLYQPIT